MFKASVAVIVFLGMNTVSYATSIDAKIFKECIGALNAIDAADLKQQSKIGVDWVKLQKTSLRMNYEGTSKEAGNSWNYVGSPASIASCILFGVDPQQIDLFIRAYHGYLPTDPFDGLAQCSAAMQIVAPEIERKVGVQRGYEIGVYLGKQTGTASSQLTHMYKTRKSFPDAIREVHARGEKIGGLLPRQGDPSRTPAVASLVAMCAWYNVPLDGVLQGVGAWSR